MVTVVNVLRERVKIVVHRPSLYGNPYSHLMANTTAARFRCETREEAIAKFAEFFYSDLGKRLRVRALAEIPDGASIGCYCAPKSCHADIIAGYLNWKRGVDIVCQN
jgi:hypothetical protein